MIAADARDRIDCTELVDETCDLLGELNDVQFRFVNASSGRVRSELGLQPSPHYGVLYTQTAATVGWTCTP
jgi:hypothetical protein